MAGDIFVVSPRVSELCSNIRPVASTEPGYLEGVYKEDGESSGHRLVLENKDSPNP